MSDKDQTTENKKPIDEIIVNGEKRSDPEIDINIKDVASTAVRMAIDPVGTGREIIKDGLLKITRGDLNKDTAQTAIGMTKEVSVGGALKSIAVTRGVYKIADAVSNGAGMAIGGVFDAASFAEDHKAAIKAMAEKNVPGYGYLEGDFNDDGKMDQIYVDATALYKNPEAKPTCYTEDNIKDQRHVGPRSKGRTRHVAEAPEVIAELKALSDQVISAAFEFAHNAEADGKDPAEEIKVAIRTPAESSIAVAALTTPSQEEPVIPTTTQAPI